MFTYIASGLLILTGCNHIVVPAPTIQITVPFTQGDTAWLRNEANHGLLRTVWIKKLKITPLGGNAFNIVYFDNMNAAFNQSDLVDEATAIQLAIDYYARVIAEAQDELSTC